MIFDSELARDILSLRFNPEEGELSVLLSGGERIPLEPVDGQSQEDLFLGIVELLDDVWDSMALMMCDLFDAASLKEVAWEETSKTLTLFLKGGLEHCYCADTPEDCQKLQEDRETAIQIMQDYGEVIAFASNTCIVFQDDLLNVGRIVHHLESCAYEISLRGLPPFHFAWWEGSGLSYRAFLQLHRNHTQAVARARTRS